ncbi:MAG: DegT/DnrJ/EryC1/StrS family aminotransferase [Planctomycetia bacterium]|nr:DegT/DnrJ/EryC1/StrS family aminotransferase [Planctomycetia bacterium]
MIPQADPSRRIARHRDAVLAAITAVVDGHEYILGSHVGRFEQAFAGSLGAAHCVGVNSGTDAIALALRATGIGRGDEVLVPALTAAGTAAAVLQAGATPRFVDVEHSTRCLDPVAIEAAIGGRTAAIVAVHLHGHPIDMPRLLEIARHRSLVVIEDCAQAHGASLDGRTVGTFGNAAAFSFYPTKNLGCIGDGGAVVTSDPNIAKRVRALRNYGWQDGERLSATAGGNSRLDELQAAILLALLPHLDAGNGERRLLARRYRETLADSAVGLPACHPGSVYHQFAITVDRRDEIRRVLRESHGIGTGVHYDSPLHLQPAFAAFADEPLPVSEQLARDMISLPIQPEVAAQAVDTIAAALRSLVGPAERKAA